jgi:hypothetical protein
MLGFSLPDVPNENWPLIFLALNGALLVFLALWWLATVTLSTPDAAQTDNPTVDEKQAPRKDDR